MTAVKYRAASFLLRALARFQRDPANRAGLLTLAREVRELPARIPPPAQSDR